jgi:hypothetical protein
MAFPASAYLDQEEGALRIAHSCGARFRYRSLQEGRTPEQIAHSFSTVTLAQVHGAIAYYLENKKLVDDFFAGVEREFERECGR